MDLKRCTRCLLPETHETITFGQHGVCNICSQQEQKHIIEWGQNKSNLDELIESYRGKYDYDCIVPFSGGKDSTWTLYYLVKEYGLKPLVVTFNHGFMRKNLKDNSERVFKKLGVDVIDFTPNWHVVRKLMLQSLLEKGDFCWHCHTGIFSYPMWVAIRYHVPLIIWGEPSSEYTAYYTYDQPEEVDEKRFNRYVNLGISAEDMFIRLEGNLDKRDLKPYSYPPLKELRKINYRSICLGSYVPWDVKKQTKIISDELGWKGDEVENVPSEYSFEKIECHMQGVRDYLKYIKRGYTRPTHLATLDIRNDRISREDGLRLIEQYEGKRPPSLDIFLEYVGLTEHEFMEIAISHEVSPHSHDPEKITPGQKLHDFNEWSREAPMPRDEASIQLQKWKNLKR
ncbi:MAG: N-acetyl sugar amidotransferase [Gammaproteobacteria bacterium]|nr:N-acetyl sugar amidotransferase [Gammaproteobacteria bacterium]